MTDKPNTQAAATAGPALTPEVQRALMDRHRAALEMADAAADRPMALAELCEVALTIAGAATAVGQAAGRGEKHPLGVYSERPAKIITTKNGGKEQVLVGLVLDSNMAVAVMNAVSALRVDRADQKPDEGVATSGSEPSEDVGPAAPGTVEADPDSPIPGVADETVTPAPHLHLVGEETNG